MISSKLRGLLLFLALSLPAFGTTLVFTGGAVDPAANPGYFSLISFVANPGTLTVLAPIGALSVSGGGTFADSALLVLQTGPPVNSPGPGALIYNGGSFALYSTTDLSLLLFGSLGNGVSTFLQPAPNDPQLFLTTFTGQVTGGLLFGNFGGYNLASSGSVNGGFATHVSLDVGLTGALGDGVYGAPLGSALVITTPEPSAIILLLGGMITLFRRSSLLPHRHD